MVNELAFRAVSEPDGIEVPKIHLADDSFKLFPSTLQPIER